MRLTVMFLVCLCLPISAGDREPLEDAIRAFASDELAERQAATRAVRELLQKRFAPLIQAMDSKDPEVARRAREVVEGLIPHRDETGRTVASPAGNWGNQVVRIIGNNAGQIWVRGQNGVWVVHNQSRKFADRIKKFGLQGYPCTQPLLRKQLGLAAGRGYVIGKVIGGSAASKIGLMPHDIIVAIDGRPVMQLESIYKELGKERTWLDRQVRVLRDGKVTTVRRAP